MSYSILRKFNFKFLLLNHKLLACRVWRLTANRRSARGNCWKARRTPPRWHWRCSGRWGWRGRHWSTRSSIVYCYIIPTVCVNQTTTSWNHCRCHRRNPLQRNRWGVYNIALHFKYQGLIYMIRVFIGDTLQNGFFSRLFRCDISLKIT